MNQLSRADQLLAGIDAAGPALDADDATGLRISMFDTDSMADPSSAAAFTWICLIDTAHATAA